MIDNDVKIIKYYKILGINKKYNSIINYKQYFI